MAQQGSSSPLHLAPLPDIVLMELEPMIQVNKVGRTKSFLVETGAACSILISYYGPFSQSCTTLHAPGKAITKCFTLTRLCLWDGLIFTHGFLVVPECSTPLLGRGLFSKMGATITLVGTLGTRPLKLLVVMGDRNTPEPWKTEPWKMGIDS